MAKRVLHIRHATAQAAVFTGKDGEITVDKGKGVVRVHDSLTPGGVVAAREDLSTTPAAVGGTSDGKMTAAQASDLAANTANIASNIINIASNSARISAIEAPAPVTAGTATAYTAIAGISAYVTGTVYKVRIHILNTGGATLALDGLPAKLIKLLNGDTLTVGDLQVDSIAEFLYNGTDFILQNPPMYYGTFLPELWDNTKSGAEGQTYSQQTGSYQKQNGLITFDVRISLSSLGTLTGTDPATIGNMPFARKTLLNGISALNAFGFGINITTEKGIFSQISSNGSLKSIALRAFTTSGDRGLTIAEITATGTIIASGTYPIKP